MPREFGTADFAAAVWTRLGNPDPALTTVCHQPNCRTCQELHREWIKEINDLAQAIRETMKEYAS